MSAVVGKVSLAQVAFHTWKWLRKLKRMGPNRMATRHPARFGTVPGQRPMKEMPYQKQGDIESWAATFSNFGPPFYWDTHNGLIPQQ